MFKGKQIVSFFLLAAALAAIVTAVSSRVSAKPSAETNDHVIFLPLLTLPEPPPTLALEPFASGFPTETITAIVNAGDERLYAVTIEGRIFIVQPDGTWVNDPFLDIESYISTDNWEEGFLGLVFHPQYPAVPYIFVSYVDLKHRIVIARYTVDASDPDHVDTDSREKLMVLTRPSNPNKDPFWWVHNGGDLHFGSDGYLYSAFGDGGPDPNIADGDTFNHGQRKDVLLGNMIRIDVDKPEATNVDCGNGFYSVPSDNPFVDGPGGQCDEIWATGFRNPWRFSFDSKTGDIYLGDVGEKLREEIDFQPANSQGGENYGWHCYEGSVDYSTVDPNVIPTCPVTTVFTMPIYEYDQSNHDCSVIGGYVYRGQQYDKLYGRYVFADFCTGRMWMLTRSGEKFWTPSPANDTGFQISTIGQGSNGELYVGNYFGGGANKNGGEIRRVTAP